MRAPAEHQERSVDLKTPVLIVVDIDSDGLDANLAVNVIKNISVKAPRHPVRLVLIARALVGQVWEQIRSAAEQFGIATDRQISLDRTALSDTEQEIHYRVALEIFNGHLGLDRSREVQVTEGRFDFITALRKARFDQNGVDLRSILLPSVGGPPRSILLVHLAALLDALMGGRGHTETTGPHLLDALIRREAAYWKEIFGQRGVDTGLQLVIFRPGGAARSGLKIGGGRPLTSLFYDPVEVVS